MPVMFLGTPAKPETGSAGFQTFGRRFSTLTCTGSRPDCSGRRTEGWGVEGDQQHYGQPPSFVVMSHSGTEKHPVCGGSPRS